LVWVLDCKKNGQLRRFSGVHFSKTYSPQNAGQRTSGDEFGVREIPHRSYGHIIFYLSNAGYFFVFFYAINDKMFLLLSTQSGQKKAQVTMPSGHQLGKRSEGTLKVWQPLPCSAEETPQPIRQRAAKAPKESPFLDLLR